MTKQLSWLQKISLNSTLVLRSSPPAPGLQRRTTRRHGSWCSHWLNTKSNPFIHVLKRFEILNTPLIYCWRSYLSHSHGDWISFDNRTIIISKFHFNSVSNILSIMGYVYLNDWNVKVYCDLHWGEVTYLLCGFSPWLPCILVRALLQSALWTAHWSSLSTCCDLLQKYFLKSH